MELMLDYEYGIFAYGVGSATAPLPIRQRRLYAIADTGLPDIWSLTPVRGRKEVVATTTTIDEGLYLIPIDAETALRYLLAGTPIQRELAEILTERWGRASIPSVADVYQQFIRQFREHW